GGPGRDGQGVQRTGGRDQSRRGALALWLQPVGKRGVAVWQRRERLVARPEGRGPPRGVHSNAGKARIAQRRGGRRRVPLRAGTANAGFGQILAQAETFTVYGAQ